MAQLGQVVRSIGMGGGSFIVAHKNCPQEAEGTSRRKLGDRRDVKEAQKALKLVLWPRLGPKAAAIPVDTGVTGCEEVLERLVCFRVSIDSSQTG